ncbi:MAG: hypothetical protein KC910_04135 [Candidatus Eremiobacteraeota bacterium]|nr:hypothetical protein [Candidatus Eremiobacteraeota bacterium]
MIARNTTGQPRSLPLHGPDYRLEIDRQGIADDVTISKRGDRIEVDGYGSADVSLRDQPDRIEIDGYGPQGDITLRSRDNRIEIDRYGSDDCTITQRGDRIEVDRPGLQSDVTYKFSGDRLEIDRYGLAGDVTVTRRGDRIEIDGYGLAGDVTIRTPFELDPVAWEAQLGLKAQGWNILSKWFEEGKPSLEDLVVLTETGQLELRDTLLV